MLLLRPFNYAWVFAVSWSYRCIFSFLRALVKGEPRDADLEHGGGEADEQDRGAGEDEQ